MKYFNDWDISPREAKQDSIARSSHIPESPTIEHIVDVGFRLHRVLVEVNELKCQEQLRTIKKHENYTQSRKRLRLIAQMKAAWWINQKILHENKDFFDILDLTFIAITLIQSRKRKDLLPTISSRIEELWIKNPNYQNIWSRLSPWQIQEIRIWNDTDNWRKDAIKDLIVCSSVT